MASQLRRDGQNICRGAQFVSDIRYMQDFFYLDELEYEKGIRMSNRLLISISISIMSASLILTPSESVQNLSVRIRQGEKVAIVGENGSGKLLLLIYSVPV
jgi:ABC-type bacteriocin/lantibiotic exporter with double-glycine peptidase domain